MINPTSAAPMIRRFNAIPKNTIKFRQLKYIQPDKKSRFSVFIGKKKKEIDIISLWEEFPIPNVREEGKLDSWNRRDGTWKIFSAKSDPQKYLKPPYYEDPNYTVSLKQSSMPMSLLLLELNLMTTKKNI